MTARNWRATSPQEVLNAWADAETAGRSFEHERRLQLVIGPENDDAIRTGLTHAASVLCAWGAAGARFPARARAVRKAIASAKKPTFSLGTTKSGDPKHPLYLAQATAMQEFLCG